MITITRSRPRLSDPQPVDYDDMEPGVVYRYHSQTGRSAFHTDRYIKPNDVSKGTNSALLVVHNGVTLTLQNGYQASKFIATDDVLTLCFCPSI